MVFIYGFIMLGTLMFVTTPNTDIKKDPPVKKEVHLDGRDRKSH